MLLEHGADPLIKTKVGVVAVLVLVLVLVLVRVLVGVLLSPWP